MNAKSGVPLSHEQAKARVLAAFPRGVDPVIESHKYPEDFYLAVLDAVGRRIPFRREIENDALRSFLYAGCLRFDRWFSPSPFVVSFERREAFARFVAAQIGAGETADNTATFRIHEIRDSVYAKFDGQSSAGVDIGLLAGPRTRLMAVPAPTHPAKIAEYRTELSVVNHDLPPA